MCLVGTSQVVLGLAANYAFGQYQFFIGVFEGEGNVVVFSAKCFDNRSS